MGLFLIGTVLVLAVVRTHFRVDELSYIRETELGTWDEIRRNARPHILDSAPDALGEEGPSDQIPRIIHQTWKTEELPERWKGAREHCAALMPDYEYMLWTDASARAFIAGEYAWFLDTYDSYRYNIERADVIRYFVLHKYGGIYMDLDIGCRRRLDSLLRFDAIVPKTIPVGVSNDLMLFKPGEPMLELLIQNLKRFNHNLITPYATIMFSTGPMYVSAVYRMNADANPSVGPSTPTDPTVGFRGVRVLPKFLYGKNAKPGETPDSFFDHMYGSSWHEGDADFLIFLRKHGRLMMAGAGVLVVLGLRRYYFGVLRVIFFALLSLVHSLATVLQRMYNDVRSMLGMASDSACLEQELAPLAPATRPGSPWDAPNVKVTQASPASGVSSVATSQLIHPPHCAADSAMDEHTQRTTQKDEALGTYSKRCDAWSTHNQSTNLPAYYVDCGSEYAMNTPRNDHLVQNEAPPRENDAQA
ncbi:hypothetical protein MVES_001269 [Malassezia vespertilionis]|uniref:Uncharacterized protein n=1 Tax=Malassezia vespertilionis TaxID=2020962 RepID=A0A2N1JEA9_9BASI|nr:hypothetical protein MVES_001269 [Malassezia vespertilionis]